MSQDAINRIADELGAIREILESYLVIPAPPAPPERLLGAEAISYVDDALLIEAEEEELRQITLGQIPNLTRD